MPAHGKAKRKGGGRDRASKGIGASIAEHLAGEGHSTVVSSLLVPFKLLLIALAHIFIVAEIHEGRFRSEAPTEQVLTRL
jgi:NAD(P)-dependent dehydrogenase (short-subunit alcohol dehydrogenase family)